MQQSLEKIQKMFRLEAERGYDNRAVVGGLDKMLATWESEARVDGMPEDLIQAVSSRLHDYPTLSPEARADVLKGLWKRFQSLHGGPTETLQPPSPKPTESAAPAYPARPQRPAPQAHPSSMPPRAPRTAIRDEENPQGLNAPLTVLPGIGPQHAQTMSALGLNTLGDLLYYFPRRYDDYSQLKPINHLFYGEEVTVIASVQSIDVRSARSGSVQLTEAIISDGTGALRVTWFNQPWLVTKLRPGTQIVLSGRIEQYLGRLVMNNPEWESLEREQLNTNRIVPVYPLTARVTQNWLRRLMHQTVLHYAPRVADYMPLSILESAQLIDLPVALQQIHFPDSADMLRQARHRLSFDEIFLMQLGVLRQKFNWQNATAQVFEVTDEWVADQTSHLPYQLTHAQQQAFADIRADLRSGRPMNRLLQGDVGSGKTVVAALAVAAITRQNAQAAVMAPTSILADQHYRSFTRLLANPEDENSPLKPGEIRLMVGDTPETEKQEIRAGLEDGSIRVVIGTHALLEAPVTFQRLQLAVIDEQHRFGVEQRAALRAKGENPHLLVMTATPIPRSLALTVYGDLDLSLMDEMPVGRLPIETHVLSPRERERAYSLIQTQVAQGHQAFIIYPLVEQGEKEEAKAAVEEHARLQKDVFPNLKLGLLHGRMKPEEKDEVMTHFRDGDMQILVSTSVVEVGVDVPNATIMLIEGANRFGLAQLHQFRGRVGRGEAQSYCLLIPENEDAVDNERLAVMAETNDGFVLAERDLEQRGPGEFLGSRQSGFADLQLASITDVRLIEKARQQAQQLFTTDPDLQAPENASLAKTLKRFWREGKGEVS